MSTVLRLLLKYARFVYILVTKTGLKEISFYLVGSDSDAWCLLKALK